MIRDAIIPLAALRDHAGLVEEALEAIVAYNAGVELAQESGSALLSELPPTTRVSLLRDALASPNWSERQSAAEHLGKLGPAAKEAVPDLLRHLNSDNPRVFAAAARALGRIGPEPGVVEGLISAIASDTEDPQVAPIEALIDIGPPAIPQLVAALRHDWLAESNDIREGAAYALGRMGPTATEAVPGLVEALRNDCSYVRRAAYLALQAITGHDFGNDYNRWYEWLQTWDGGGG